MEIRITNAESIQYGFRCKCENGGVTITKYTGEEKHVVVPAYIDGFPVKQISRSNSVSVTGAFSYNKKIESVVLPETLEIIESYTFYMCSNLKNVNIPNSVTSIGDSSFRNCILLNNMIIPNGVTNIGDYAFAYCKSLDKVMNIPDKVTKIGCYAFHDCESLEKVVVSENVTSIGACAFLNVPCITYHGFAINPDLAFPMWGAKSMN